MDVDGAGPGLSRTSAHNEAPGSDEENGDRGGNAPYSLRTAESGAWAVTKACAKTYDKIHQLGMTTLEMAQHYEAPILLKKPSQRKDYIELHLPLLTSRDLDENDLLKWPIGRILKDCSMGHADGPKEGAVVWAVLGEAEVSASHCMTFKV